MTIAAVVVLAALSLSVARILFTATDHFSLQVESNVSAFIGLPVKIRKLAVAWRGIHPVLKLADVQIYDARTDTVLLHLNEIRVTLDLFMSLINMQFQPAGITLVGTRLDLVRKEDGSVGVQGFPEVENAPSLMGLVLGQPRFALLDVDLRWNDLTGATPPIALNQVRFGINNRGRHRRLRAAAGLPDQLGKALQVIADLRWNPNSGQRWNGEVYVQGDNLQLPAWAALGVDEIAGLQGEADIRVWTHIFEGQLQSIQSEISGRHIAWQRGTNDSTPLPVADAISSILMWQREGDGWLMGGKNLQVRMDGKSWPETDFRVSVAEDAESATKSIALTANALELSGVLPLIFETGLIPVRQSNLIPAMRLQGQLHNLQLQVGYQGDGPPKVSFSTEFTGLESAPVEKLPGISGLNGRAVGTLQQGSVYLSGKLVTLSAPMLFQKTIPLDLVTGNLIWRQSDNLLTLETSDFVVEGEGIKTRSRMRLELPARDGAPLLDFQLALHDSDLGEIRRYLPTRVLPAGASKWLDHALVSGGISSGAVLFYGAPADFPFDHSQGTFQARLNVEQAVLNYSDSWTRIEELAAEVVFRNKSMVVDAVGGKILNADILDVYAEIEDLGRSGVKIRGNLKGPLADMLRFVNESPLNAVYGEPLGPIDADGTAHLNLSLNIPLHDKKAPIGVRGTVAFSENKLHFVGPDLSFAKTEGELNFTESEFSAEGIDARMEGGPVQIGVDTRQIEGKWESRVRVTGPLGLVKIVQKMKLPVVSKRITGSAPWQAVIRIPRKLPDQPRKPLVLELQTDLRGVQVDLPAPLGKKKEAAVPFGFAATVEGNRLGSMQLRYGKSFTAALKTNSIDDAVTLERGELQFGGKTARLPAQAELQITGHVAQLPVMDWIHVMTADNRDGGAPLRVQDLEVEYLQGLSLAVDRVTINAGKSENGWDIQLQGPSAQGLLNWREDKQGNKQLRMVMDRLTLIAGPEAADTISDPAAVPALDISVQHAVFKGIDVGKLILQTMPNGNRMQVRRLEMNADWAHLVAEGDWTPQDGQQLSQFQITLMEGDLGKMLSTFGYAGSVSEGMTRGELSASWRGSPADFAFENLDGTLHFTVKKGRLLGVEPGAGRIFGLLSLQALPRRLLGDFGDFFKKGFSFDEINGSFVLQDGDAYTNDMMIDGPAATISVSGRTGLSSKDYDQVITVVPSMRSSLSLAGAIAAGPAAGAAIFLADKFLAKSTTGTRYRLAGTWDEPQLERLDVEETPNNEFINEE